MAILSQCSKRLLAFSRDVTFVVGEEQLLVRAHRLVLAMASPVFAAALYPESKVHFLP